MNKFAIAGALLLGSISCASAASYNYTFGTASGGAYCDGVKLKSSGVVLTGKHDATKGSGCTEGDYAGGFIVKIKGVHGSLLDVTTTDVNNSGANYTFVFLLDPAKLEWSLYAQDTVDGITFEEINAGLLIDDSKVIAPVGHRTAAYKITKK